MELYFSGSLPICPTPSPLLFCFLLKLGLAVPHGVEVASAGIAFAFGDMPAAGFPQETLVRPGKFSSPHLLGLLTFLFLLGSVLITLVFQWLCEFYVGQLVKLLACSCSSSIVSLLSTGPAVMSPSLVTLKTCRATISSESTACLSVLLILFKSDLVWFPVSLFLFYCTVSHFYLYYFLPSIFGFNLFLFF